MAALVAIGAAALMWSNRTIPDNVRAERRSRAISGLRRDLIDHIEIDRGTEQIALFKVNGKWTVTIQGARVEADDTEVERLLSEIEFAEPIRALGTMDARNRAQFGLDAPRARVALYEQNHGAVVRFAVGREAVDSQGAYVESEGQGFVLGLTAANAFVIHARELRARNLVELDSARVTAVTLTHNSQTIRIEKRNGFWSAVSGERLARAPLEALLADLHELRATRFIEDRAEDQRLATLGLSPPRATIVVERRGQSSVSLSLGAPCPGHADEVAIRRNDDRVVACVASTTAQHAERELARWQDSRLFFARADEVERVVLHRNARDFTLLRTGDGWRIEGSQEGLDADAVQQWLDRTLSTSVERRALDAGTVSAPNSQDNAAVTWIEVARTGVEAKERVTVLGSDSENTFVRRESDGAALALSPRAISELFVDDVRFRATSIIRDVPEELRVLVTESPSFRDEVEKRDGRWQLLRPMQVDGDPLVLRTTAERLASLDAVRWVSRDIRPEFGLTNPRSRMIARFEGQGAPQADGGAPRLREYTLLVGSTSPDGVYCKLAERDGVFLLTQSIVDELVQPHVQRAIFSLNREQVTRVELLVRGRAPLQIARTPSGWLTPAGVRVDRTHVEQLLSTIESIRAPRAFSYGPSTAEQDIGRRVLSIVTTDPDGGTQSYRLSLGAEFAGQPGGIYARLAGIDATLSVSVEVIGALDVLAP